MIGRSLALLVVWIALWGELSVANVASGVIVIAGLTVLFPSVTQVTHRIHPIGVVRFGARLLMDLVLSSWNVVVAVMRPDADRIHTDVLTVALTTRSRLVASIVANSITLTPGTMTVDISEGTNGADGTGHTDGTGHAGGGDAGFVLRVHTLGRVDPDEFAEQIGALERRVVAAATPIVPDGSRSARSARSSRSARSATSASSRDEDGGGS